MRTIGPKSATAPMALMALMALLALLTACSNAATPATPDATQGATQVATGSAPALSPSSDKSPQQAESFSLVATGDVLLHESLWAQARTDARSNGEKGMDFAPMLAGVRPYVEKADIGLCHLETPLAPRGGPFSGYPSFSGPPQIAKGLATTGYDVCSTASNHTLDQGAAGIDRTLDDLDQAGIEHTGSARTEKESRKLTTLRINGVKVAFLSYAYGFNGMNYPDGQTWRANKIDEQTIIEDAENAREAGAAVVVASLHWGTEYSQKPSAQQLELAPVLARSGKLDLIISHHAHVVEPIAKIGKTWVVYGLGNLIADHSTPVPENAEGLLTRFTFERKPGAKRFIVSKAEYAPLLMTKQSPYRVLDVRAALREKDYGSTTRQRLLEALRRTTTVVESMGGANQGLTPATP